MREIKFRGQVRYNSKKYKKGEWYYGNYRRGRNGRSFIEEDYEEVEVIPETIGQYTGLKDKNGKEIYEGDIVQQFDINENGIIEYKYGQFGLNCLGMFWNIHPTKIEVVGNIYENKELLEA